MRRGAKWICSCIFSSFQIHRQIFNIVFWLFDRSRSRSLLSLSLFFIHSVLNTFNVPFIYCSLFVHKRIFCIALRPWNNLGSVCFETAMRPFVYFDPCEHWNLLHGSTLNSPTSPKRKHPWHTELLNGTANRSEKWFLCWMREWLSASLFLQHSPAPIGFNL